jgi:hypothetical protein
MAEQKAGRIYAARGCAVLSGGCLVLSAILASLGSEDLPMVRILTNIDPDLPARLQDDCLAWFGHGFWIDVILPLLVRPAWFVPLASALVFAGLAMSISPLSAATGRSRG